MCEWAGVDLCLTTSVKIKDMTTKTPELTKQVTDNSGESYPPVTDRRFELNSFEDTVTSSQLQTTPPCADRRRDPVWSSINISSSSYDPPPPPNPKLTVACNPIYRPTKPTEETHDSWASALHRPSACLRFPPQSRTCMVRPTCSATADDVSERVQGALPSIPLITLKPR